MKLNPFLDLLKNYNFSRRYRFWTRETAGAKRDPGHSLFWRWGKAPDLSGSHMRQNASPEALDGAWKPGFSGQIPDRLVIAEQLEGSVIDLEGHELFAVELGHTDTDHTICFNVPSIGLVVAGDAAYNDVHLYLAESNAQKRQEWIAALDKIQSLNPRAVVASHKRPENADDPRIIEETPQYIRDFDRLAEMTKTA